MPNIVDDDFADQLATTIVRVVVSLFARQFQQNMSVAGDRPHVLPVIELNFKNAIPNILEDG
jgi:hypothetical protein